MQRPWGRTGPGVLEEQRGGPSVWSRVSEGERGRRGGQGGERGRCAGPVGLREGPRPYLFLTIKREGVLFPLVLMEQMKLWLLNVIVPPQGRLAQALSLLVPLISPVLFGWAGGPCPQ